MPKLIIKRANEYMNRARKIGLYLDGNKVSTIANNATQEFDVAEGTHTVKAKIDWCGSRDFQFSIKEGETKYLHLSSIPYVNPIMLTWAILAALNLMLLYSTGKHYLQYVSIPFVLLLAYYFTLGRNDYLKIKEHDPFQ